MPLALRGMETSLDRAANTTFCACAPAKPPAPPAKTCAKARPRWRRSARRSSVAADFGNYFTACTFSPFSRPWSSMLTLRRRQAAIERFSWPSDSR